MRELLSRIERASRLDRLADPIQERVLSILRPRRLRDALHGVWLGHPLHPALVQVPIGAWTSVAVLDLLRGQRRAATILTGVGVGGALPAVVTGLNDWASLSPEQRRVGLVHAVANQIALVLYAGSFAARLTGRHNVGRALAYLGFASASGGAYLGGHLAYKQAAGVNQAVPQLHLISDGWHPVADLSSLPEDQLVSRLIDDVRVLVYRDGDDITVMLEHCPHQNGPLSEGSLTRIEGRACVVCPWHGSTFELANGEAVHGPAATDQQVLRSRVVDGRVEAQLP
ncbi:Rieske 2Fe-2S domain-containing protein [Polymorphospora lycopeni]|uniref:Rieske 2Fe-2S domain-containing protein n=1 Tax=Polymorphospora lycopeni TaxID=3140240 RepID=A0ABV5CID1_9ACTN